MSNILKYKGYYAKVEYIAEDNILHGRVEGLRDVISFDAQSTDELQKAFEEAVDDYLDFCKEIGKEPDKVFRGSFNIRISPDLHRRLRIASDRMGVTMNAYIEMALNEYQTAQDQAAEEVFSEKIQLKNYGKSYGYSRQRGPSLQLLR